MFKGNGVVSVYVSLECFENLVKCFSGMPKHPVALRGFDTVEPDLESRRTPSNPSVQHSTVALNDSRDRSGGQFQVNVSQSGECSGVISAKNDRERSC